ncbi:MAG: HAD family phosphatase [Nanoarchaeota archaeon]|nr:HAD family phosphatase [DPANN group archaeon]MBL7116699.1 HAD family phosphatase [Nanoarchaeota archaeon]
MIKLIIFDMSDVCSNSEEPPFIEGFMKIHGLPEVFEEEYYELGYKAEMDEISGRKVWETLIKKYNIQETPEEIMEAMMKTKEFYPEMLEFTNNLREKHKVVCFTNYCEDYWKLFEDKIKDYFDEVIVSYQLKTRKPKPEGFKIILRKYNVKPEEAVFIDDTKKSVEQAASLGIKAIQFKNKEQLLEELEGIGVIK